MRSTNPLDGLANDEVHVHKSDGRTLGPYKARVGPSTILTFDKHADFDPGDRISRRLPNGKTENYFVVEANYTDADGVAPEMSHWNVKTSRNAPSDAQPAPAPAGTTYNVSAQNVQIGDGNLQNIATALEYLVSAVASSGATPEEKNEAKGLIRRALEHPLLLAVVGGASGALFKSVFGADHQGQ